jgi:hypothetical protein
MKFDSPFFDRIRVKPSADRRRRAGSPLCDWQGCEQQAMHRAPKGRTREGEYWRFCVEHVREYNHSYNYFAGMSDDAVVSYQKDAITGHRPTWKMGVNGARHAFANGAVDPFEIFQEFGPGARARADEARVASARRTVRNAERKALDTLGLGIDVTAVEIKARYKMLVKRHHPDANGGDRSCEDKLREIIQAYSYLRTAGLC